MIKIKINHYDYCWSDYNNSPNLDDCHLISEFSEHDIIADCIFSHNGMHQVIYRGYIFWIIDSLEVSYG